jgi:hypothetical protein
VDPISLTDNLEVVDCILLIKTLGGGYEPGMRIVWGGGGAMRWRVERCGHLWASTYKSAKANADDLAKRIGGVQLKHKPPK